MDNKINNISEYQVYDFNVNAMYMLPVELPDEYPYYIYGVDTNEQVYEYEVKDEDYVPITINDIWYYYSSQEIIAEQEPEQAYSVMTNGQILSYTSRDNEQQAFYFFDADGNFVTLYMLNIPYDDPCIVYTDQIWFAAMWAGIAGMLLVFIATMADTISVVRSRKKVKKEGGN